MHPRARLTLTPPPAWARALHSFYLPKLRSPSPAPGPSRCQCTPPLRSQPANPAAHSPRALLSLRLLPHPAFSSSLRPIPPPYSALPSLLPSISPPPSPCTASPSFHLHLPSSSPPPPPSPLVLLSSYPPTCSHWFDVWLGVSALERAAPLGPALEMEVQCSRRSRGPQLYVPRLERTRRWGPGGQKACWAGLGGRGLGGWRVRRKAGGELMLGRRDRVH